MHGRLSPRAIPVSRKRPMRRSAGPIIGIKLGTHEPERGQAARDIAHVPDLRRRQRAAEQRLFAIGQPFLYDLITANRKVPHS